MKTVTRDGWIDTLRALGAVAVVLFHFNRVMAPAATDTLGGMWHAFWLRGYWGVGVFFALGGYCSIPDGTGRRVCSNSLRRRVSRIFPPYWASLLLIVLLVLTFKLSTGVNDIAPLPRTPMAIGATLFLFTDPVTTIPTINWVYWTLSCMLACYLVAGLVLLTPRGNRVTALAVVHIALCLLAALWQPGTTGPGFVATYWPAFGTGLALAVWYQQRTAGGLMLLASLFHAAWLVTRGGGGPVEFAWVGIITAGVIALCRNRAFPAWGRPFAGIGKISYSLYLVHVPVGVGVLGRFFPQVIPGTLRFIGSQLGLLAVTTAAAAVFYLAAEKPFLPAPPSPARS